MKDSRPGEIIGISEDAQRQRQFASDAAMSSDPVTLIGEPGTGKELLAQIIHDGSARTMAPFLMIDCSLYYERELKRELFGYGAGLAGGTGKKGLLEFAANGTCYLSRIEELTPTLQKSLLEFVATGAFQRLGDTTRIESNVRMIVSSEKNLRGFMEAGLFDRELYERLSRASIRLSPVRERKDDIRVVMESVAARFATERKGPAHLELTPEALQALQSYPWPSNFDEVIREVQRLFDHNVRLVRCENLATEIAGYWMGQQGDPDVRRVIEELDGYIREFKILSRLEAGLGEPLPSAEAWCEEEEDVRQRDLLEGF